MFVFLPSKTACSNFILVLITSVLISCGGSGSSAPSLNSAPTVNNVSLIDINGGSAVEGDSLTGSYTYADEENDVEGVSTYRWLRDNAAISGANELTYTLVSADVSAQISFEVTPVAQTGTFDGVAIVSNSVIAQAQQIFPLSINNPSVVEGQLTDSTEVIFTLTLNEAATSNFTVDYASADNTAIVAGGDYMPVSGTATLLIGTRTTDISVFVSGDNVLEADELFNLVISNPQGISLGQSSITGVATIINDDFTPGTAWDISTAFYSENSINSFGLDTNLTDAAFKSDGTKLYFIGERTDRVYQVSVNTPWDLGNSASFDSVSFDVSLQEGTAQAIDIKTDGTSLYILGSANKTVYQYDMTEAWNLSTASYSNKSFLASQASFATGVRFKPDGLVMYVTSTSGIVHQYNLSTAWDVSTASFSNLSYAMSTEMTNLHGIAFKDDGSKFYVTDSFANRILQYSLSTSWNISTASYDSVILAGAAGVTRGIFFKPDGLVFYTSASSPSGVYQFEIH